MLARDEALALLQTRYDAVVDTLTIQKGTDTLLTAPLATEAGRSDIEKFFFTYLGKNELAPRLVRAPKHKFTDISAVSPDKIRAITKARESP